MVPVQGLGPSKFIEVFSWDDLGEDCSLLDVKEETSRSKGFLRNGHNVPVLTPLLIGSLWGNRVG